VTGASHASRALAWVGSFGGAGSSVAVVTRV
jgi:hypothetical protein